MLRKKLSDEFLEKPKKRKDSLSHHALGYNFELMHIGCALLFIGRIK
jgi:hypothetical protein